MTLHAEVSQFDRAAWSTALPDWQERIMEGRSLVPELPLHDRVAEKALEIFKRLRVPDLPGQPTYGEVCGEWVFALVRAIFGSYDPETKRRALQEFFLLVPKKNGKSAIAAAIIVTAAILNARPYAECILIAPTQKISDISFKQARGIIQLDQSLSQLFHVQDHKKQITHRTTQAVIMILSADGDVVTGSKGTFILIDETHVLASKAKAADIFLELRGGLAARPDGFMLQITTQSKSEPRGQFKVELQRARAVRDGLSDYPMLPVLYELPPEVVQSGDWRDEETWALVNPHLGFSVDREWLRTQAQEAESGGADALALFASQHLNVEIGLGLHSDRWIGAEYWTGNADPELVDLKALIARADVAVAGGDIGGADDLFGMQVIGRDRETRAWLCWARAWCTTAVLERRKEIAPALRDFAAEGDLVIDDDVAAHVTEFADICDQLRDARLLPQKAAIGLDPWGVAALLDELVGRGYTDDQIYGVSQGWRLSGAIKGLERRLFQGTLLHGDQPMMRWCVGNAKVETRGNNIFVTKERSGSAKIDPLVALFNAAMLMDMNPEAGGGKAVRIPAGYVVG